MLRAPGSLTSGEIDAVRLVGPSTPATKRGLSGVRARERVGRLARESRTGEIQLLHVLLHAVVGHRDRGSS